MPPHGAVELLLVHPLQPWTSLGRSSLIQSWSLVSRNLVQLSIIYSTKKLISHGINACTTSQQYQQYHHQSKQHTTQQQCQDMHHTGPTVPLHKSVLTQQLGLSICCELQWEFGTRQSHSLPKSVAE